MKNNDALLGQLQALLPGVSQKGSIEKGDLLILFGKLFGPVQVRGGLSESKGEFAGYARISTPTIKLKGWVGITLKNGMPSMFVYAIGQKKQGKPTEAVDTGASELEEDPVITIEGVAAGFGFHRHLVIPPVSGVHTFPLVKEAMRKDWKIKTVEALVDAVGKAAEQVLQEEKERLERELVKLLNSFLSQGLGLIIHPNFDIPALGGLFDELKKAIGEISISGLSAELAKIRTRLLQNLTELAVKLEDLIPAAVPNLKVRWELALKKLPDVDDPLASIKALYTELWNQLFVALPRFTPAFLDVQRLTDNILKDMKTLEGAVKALPQELMSKIEADWAAISRFYIGLGLPDIKIWLALPKTMLPDLLTSLGAALRKLRDLAADIPNFDIGIKIQTEEAFRATLTALEAFLPGIKGFSIDFQAPVIYDLHQLQDLISQFLTFSSIGIRALSSYVSEKVKEMEDVNPVDPNGDWLAAGVKFNTFKLIESFALAIASKSATTEFDLLGLSRIRYPKILLAAQFKGRWNPEEGLLSYEGALTPDSYLFIDSAKLIGGMARYYWYKGPHKGNFVITAGGYDPDFTIPRWYPRPDRLRIRFKVGPATIKGSAYFAMTPKEVMAGGDLKLDYKRGKLKCWIKAGARFTAQWKPFHYSAEMHVSVGASYRIKVGFIHKTIHVSLGALLRLWGPQFGGKARLNLHVAHVTVHFGKGDESPPALGWGDFEDQMLPALRTIRSASGQPSRLRAPALAAVDTSTTTRLTYLLKSGLIRNFVNQQGQKAWVVNACDFLVAITSPVPITRWERCPADSENADRLLVAVQQAPQDRGAKIRQDIGVRPMKMDGMRSSLNVWIEAREEDVGDAGWTDVLEPLQYTLIRKNAPAAAWGVPGTDDPENGTIPNVTYGIRLSFLQIAWDNVEPTGIEQLGYERRDPGSFEAAAPLPVDKKSFGTEDPVQKIRSDIRDKPKRKGILLALKAAGAKVREVAIFGDGNDAPGFSFLASPSLAATGQL